MQFVAKKENLLKELTLIQGIVEKRNTRPILANALLESDGDAIKIYATDLEVGLSSAFIAQIGRGGAITAPAKKLADIVRLLPNEQDVSIEVMDNHFLKINCDKIEYKLTGAPREDFPTIPKPSDSNSISIPGGILKMMIAQTIYAITAEETRYALNGAQLAILPDAIRMVTTDAHRLAFSQFEVETGVSSPVEILVPRKTVAELRTLIEDGAEAVNFSYTDNHLFFRIKDRLLDSRNLEGQFPNFEKVLPKDNDKAVAINRELFDKAIDRVALLSHETSRAIKLNITTDIMVISSSHPEVGEAKEEIEVSYEGPELTIGFNSKYLSDFIASATSENVILELRDDTAAGLLRPASDEQGEYKYVIMPMRI